MNNLSLQERIDIITHKLKFIAQDVRPATLFLTAPYPFEECKDTTLERYSHFAGGVRVGMDNGAVNLAEVIVIITPHPMEQIIGDIAPFFGTDNWANTPALKNNRLFVVNHSMIMNRVQEIEQMETIEMLAEILYPQYFNFGYEGAHWFRFEWQ